MSTQTTPPEDPSLSSSQADTSSPPTAPHRPKSYPQALFPPLDASSSSTSAAVSGAGAGPSTASSPPYSTTWSHQHGSSQHSTFPMPPRIPEKCLTFCSQRADAPAMCRMFCLRRRAPLPTRAESLARLRPPPLSPAVLGATDEQSSTWSWSPFEALRERLAPWSFLYLRGTPDGVVGRYMEELEGDDGVSDFGPVSRHAPVSDRRRSTGEFEWLDWGEAGSLVHIPLTSLFAPIINLPTNTYRVLNPSTSLISRYIESFTDGSQMRGLNRFAEEVESGGAAKMIGNIGNFYGRKIREREEALRLAQQGEGIRSGSTTSARPARPDAKEAEEKGE